MRVFGSILIALSTITAASALATAAPKRIAVFGGTGYVGSAVCERLVKRGYDVTAVSRRGTNPKPGNDALDQVTWVKGDATDAATVREIVNNSDGAVHAIGLLFDVESGLTNLNTIVSGSGSIPGDKSTYDAITRQTMFNVADAIEKKPSFPFGAKEKFPLCFVSAAEAGWPDTIGGPTVEEKFAPEWLKKYLAAKRSVEERLTTSNKIRAAIYRPSLIWDWTKFDVLPAIPVFNVLSAVGVPFVDKTVRVETLADAIVQGIADSDVEGVQRYMQMEKLQQIAKQS